VGLAGGYLCSLSAPNKGRVFIKLSPLQVSAWACKVSFYLKIFCKVSLN